MERELVRLSEHFHEREFRCPCAERGYTGPEFCGGGVGEGIDPLLIEGLEYLRRRWNKPVIVTSGYRCRAYNATVGGAQGSLHLTGKAADIRIDGIAPDAVLQEIEAIGLFTGRGRYPDDGFVHVDVRAGLLAVGRPVARWERRDGVYRTVARFPLAIGKEA